MTSSSPNVNVPKHDLYAERFRAVKNQLSPGLLRVAQYINDNRSRVLEKTALAIAADTQTSDATVIRTIQTLGFSGLRDLKTVLAGYLGVTPRSPGKMVNTVKKLAQDTHASIDFVLQSYRASCAMLDSSENRQAITASVTLMQTADRVAIFGIGASAIMAEYAARLFNRNAIPAYVLNRTGIALSEQLHHMRQGDVLVMLAQKSAHTEGMTTVSEAKRLGMPIILLTGSQETFFTTQADQVIIIPRSATSEMMPVHATPLICLEILVLALSASAPVLTMNSINRLYELSNTLSRAGKK